MSGLRSGPTRRTRQLALAIGVVALVGAGGWFAGAQMQSPADAAAAHQPPKAGPVTVAVDRQELTATVVAQGSVEFGAPHEVSMAGAVGSTGASGDADAAQRVTKLPTEDTVLNEGSVLMQVNGRPVFVLRGTVPMYRTLGPGSSGDDVRQLQQALRRLGFDPGAVSGAYRQGTADAVTRWYQNKGFAPQKPSTADQQQLGDLEAAVSSAQLALLEVQGSGDSEESGVADTPALPESDQAHSIQLHAAQQQMTHANAALSAFRATYGTKIPAGEVVFLPDLPVRVDKVMAHLAATPEGDVVTVTNSDVVVRAVVPRTDGAVLRKGMEAQIEAPDGTRVRGVVSSVGGAGTQTGGKDGVGSRQGQDEAEKADEDSDADSGDPSAPVPLEISVPEPGKLKNQSGGTAKVTIEVGASQGAALTVPVAAVHTSADGQARVRVQRSGRVVDVHVVVGISAAGLVEVRPDGDTLEEGDQVVVGQ